MVEYRNQHFVPEFLLDSWAHNGKAVTLHFESSHEQKNQDISKICSKNYLYTPKHDTQLEKELGRLESYQAVPIKKLRKGRSPNHLLDSDYNFLYSYIFTQRLRTRMYRKELLDAGKQIYDEMLWYKYSGLINQKKELHINKDLFDSLRYEKIRESVKQIQNYIMMHGILGILLHDLDMVLALNKTSEEFVCSDSPVIFDNIRFKHERKKNYAGVANRGCIIYCPISPKYYVILYDPAVYTVEQDENNLMYINDLKVVEMLNRLQLMNSDDIVVYSEPNKKRRSSKII